MESALVGVAVLVVSIILFFGILNEVVCIYQNPFPLFRNKDKRFWIVDKYKTRSILKDMHYDA